MLTHINRKEILELIKDGPKSVNKWLDDMIEQLEEAPIEEYSGQLIDKRPEQKRRDPDPIDLSSIHQDDDYIVGPVMEIEVGTYRPPTKWQRVKALVLSLFGFKQKTEEEEIDDLVELYSPFGEHHKEIEKDDVIPNKPKDLVMYLDTLRSVLNYAEINFPTESDWNVVRDRTAVLRKLLSKNLGPVRKVTISKGAGVVLDVEVSKVVEITPETINRHLRMSRN